jgi:hypothetical protein
MVIEDVSQGEISRNPRAYQELIAAAAAQTDLVSALTAMFDPSVIMPAAGGTFASGFTIWRRSGPGEPWRYVAE